MDPTSAVPSQFVPPSCHSCQEKSTNSNSYKTNPSNSQPTSHSAVNTNGRETFASFVNRTLPQALDRITTNAQQASRLAKLTHGVNQQRLYARKARLISSALELDPLAFAVDSFDVRAGLFGLERFTNGVRLHALAHRLSPTARAAVLEQMQTALAAVEIAA